jgi:hypothetical protein
MGRQERYNHNPNQASRALIAESASEDRLGAPFYGPLFPVVGGSYLVGQGVRIEVTIRVRPESKLIDARGWPWLKRQRFNVKMSHHEDSANPSLSALWSSARGLIVQIWYDFR